MFKILLCCLCLPFILPVQPVKKLNITVNYNPRSSVSKKFINEQLYPVWFTNKHFINLQLLPIAELDPSEVESEDIYENDEKLVHACVLKLFPSSTAYQIIDCLLVNKINQCVTQMFKLSINACVTSGLGTETLSKMKGRNWRVTKSQSLVNTFVDSTIYKDSEIFTNFDNFFCKKYKKIHKICIGNCCKTTCGCPHYFYYSHSCPCY